MLMLSQANYQLILNMKKLFSAAALILGMQATYSQAIPPTDTTAATVTSPRTRTDWKNVDLSNRGNDHVLLQFGRDSWGSTPDSIRTTGFSRHFNIYFMLDKPFKTNPRMSVGFGAGIGSSNIFFNRTFIDIKAAGTRLPFTNQDSTNNFKKFKLATVFLEAPVELRYSSNPINPSKSIKVAIGGKVGTLLSAHTKGKTLQDKNGQAISNYIVKEKSKKFFNTTRLAATARVGYGLFSIHGTYQFTNFLKEGAGPEIRPYSIGITISGL